LQGSRVSRSPHIIEQMTYQHSRTFILCLYAILPTFHSPLVNEDAIFGAWVHFTVLALIISIDHQEVPVQR